LFSASVSISCCILLGTAKALADGTFSKSFSVPAYTSGNYKISAYNLTKSGYTISDDVST